MIVFGIVLSALLLGGWLGFLAEAAVYVVVFAVLMYFIGLNKGEKNLIKGKLKKFLHK